MRWLALAAGWLLAAAPSRAIITTSYYPDPPASQVINILTGADRFYEAGFYGNSAIIANVEAGHVWDGHETLNGVGIFVNDPSIEGTERQYDAHATAVGFTMAGLGPEAPEGGYYWYQVGMAPGALLASAAIATSFASDGSFEVSGQSFLYAYQTTMQDGVPVEIFPGITMSIPVDVVNSSWGFSDAAGDHPYTMALDALAYANHQTVTLPSGNHDGTEAAGPAVGMSSGYNSITVASMGSDISNPPFSQLSEFSNIGPNDFVNPLTGEVITGARAAVDIAAPGEALVLAAYSGTTGGNTGGTDPWEPAPGEPDERPGLYFNGIAGTSFASAVVAGGAALVVDAGYRALGGGAAVDGRVVKAVLMNSAQKPGDWSNNSVVEDGVVVTRQALDYDTGAGVMHLRGAYDQFLGGTTDVAGDGGGTVRPVGWDLGMVSDAQLFNEYRIDEMLLAGDTFRVTLDWFVNRTLEGTVDPETDLPVANDVQFANLDLELWHLAENDLATLVGRSETLFDNVEHLYMPLPYDGYYALRVLWNGVVYDVPGDTADSEYYGLAWFVPEPSAWFMLAVAAVGAACARKRAHRTSNL